MKRSELNIELGKKLEELITASESKGKLMTPLEFTEVLISFFENKGILNPTHFAMDEDKNLHQITGFEPEVEDEDKV